jgi:hypothetical protein
MNLRRSVSPAPFSVSCVGEQHSDLAFTQEIVAVSPKTWEDGERFEGSRFAASQGTAQTSGTVENPASAKTPKALPPTPPELLSGVQQATQE